MDWLPPTIATRSLLPFPRGGEGGVLFLFPIETAEGKRAAAALLPREAILNTILEDTAVMVTSDDLRYLAAIPEVLATGSRQGATGIQDVKQEYLAVISPLDAANSAIYINFALDNPSIESQAYHLLWIEHALSSNDKDRVSKILRPLRGGALDELKNKPVRIADTDDMDGAK